MKLMDIVWKNRAIAATQESKSRSAGFTLIELLIVLAVIGGIATVVYQRSGNSKEASRQAQYNQQVTAIVSNARDWMQTFSTTGAAGTDLTAAAITAGVFPGDTNPSSGPFAPWGGTYKLLANGVNSFQLSVPSVSQAGCNKVLAKQTGDASDVGLTAISVNATVTAMPVTTSVCANSGNANTILYTWTVNS